MNISHPVHPRANYRENTCALIYDSIQQHNGLVYVFFILFYKKTDSLKLNN